MMQRMASTVTHQDSARPAVKVKCVERQMRAKVRKPGQLHVHKLLASKFAYVHLNQSALQPLPFVLALAAEEFMLENGPEAECLLVRDDRRPAVA